VTLDNHGVQEPLVPKEGATLISQYKIKMPGYGKRMERFTPEPTKETPELEQRFVMPKVTLVQLTILAMILYYAWSVRKMNKAVVSTAALAIGLLHMYDHMYRVKRGDERLFFFPEAKKEGYCGACRK
jgi:hypothetical protein